jgi:hypothetical protein
MVDSWQLVFLEVSKTALLHSPAIQAFASAASGFNGRSNGSDFGERVGQSGRLDAPAVLWG